MPKGIYKRSAEHNQKISERMKKIWANPENKIKLSEKMKLSAPLGIVRNENIKKHGQDHPSYKNGSGQGHQYKYVEESIKLLGYNCQLCNSPEFVNLHHKDGNPQNNEIGNWQRLCSSCHRTIHSKYFGLSEVEKMEFQKKLHARTMKKYYIKTNRLIDWDKYKGYISGGEACKKLNISRQRLNQIKNKLECINPHENRGTLYKLESVENYKPNTLAGRPKINKNNT